MFVISESNEVILTKDCLKTGKIPNRCLAGNLEPKHVFIYITFIVTIRLSGLI